MQRAMLRWNSVPTQVITEGRWVEEGISQIGKKDVVVVIPGNPGIPEFYEGFIRNLKLRLPTEVPVWVVGHAGHVHPPDNLSVTMPSTSAWHTHYGLMAQIEHKKEFIKKYVPKDAKLHLVGHSIGCWIILNMLKDELIAEQVVKCYMLFPTIEHMAKTRNGQYYTSFMMKIQFILLFLGWLLICLPIFLQGFIINLIRLFYGIPKRHNKALGLFCDSRNLRNVFKMANEEMEIVKERDDDIIAKYNDKLWFYYGNRDGWAPVTYYNDLKSAHPNINATLCKHGYPHTFVLKYEKEVGQIVGDIINENIL
ncbi:lipid droplet associated hydrolase sturkopf [Megachile rotundata]|uniref:lipid droplet associated hydrolase sturkopf n=1 Tax=Megachile rotundata TaxID=143995 RepID=UPI000615108C|nr:PREDICTED: UPF0554 protein C2orf43 homolog [Megachile rotundata]XP_012153688.1 PREDICTED: UPF0554 protein C2orf43 homolog [Megachile rotundata]XP_012153689.1 PREDICTED: UPF0554 protein C2orf43 homolog [Megachile rotundata]